jgi:hypothetical protein
MRLCGPRWATEAEALHSKAMLVPGAELVKGCPCKGVHVRGPRPVPVLPPPRRPATGFSARVKLLVRVRAGMGDANDACCEACGHPLGRDNGQVHHIINRGMGGCTDAVLNSPVGATLLCGDPFTGCHGLATEFDAGIGARGFWLKHSADLRLEPMTLHSGTRVWRSEDGRYLFEPPEVRAA